MNVPPLPIGNETMCGPVDAKPPPVGEIAAPSTKTVLAVLTTLNGGAMLTWLKYDCLNPPALIHIVVVDGSMARSIARKIWPCTSVAARTVSVNVSKPSALRPLTAIAYLPAGLIAISLGSHGSFLPSWMQRPAWTSFVTVFVVVLMMAISWAPGSVTITLCPSGPPTATPDPVLGNVMLSTTERVWTETTTSCVPATTYNLSPNGVVAMPVTAAGIGTVATTKTEFVFTKSIWSGILCDAKSSGCVG